MFFSHYKEYNPLTLVPRKLKIVGYCQKNICIWNIICKQISPSKSLIHRQVTQKIQALSVNFDGIADIGPKGRPKSEREKIREKRNSFYSHFPNDFQ